VVPDRQRGRELIGATPSAEERAQIEAEILLARLEPGDAAPGLGDPARLAQRDIAPAGPPARDVLEDGLLVALDALVQEQVVAAKPALAQLVLERGEVIDCQATVYPLPAGRS
jgi:hypothetical protein